MSFFTVHNMLPAICYLGMIFGFTAWGMSMESTPKEYSEYVHKDNSDVNTKQD